MERAGWACKQDNGKGHPNCFFREYKHKLDFPIFRPDYSFLKIMLARPQSQA